VVESQTETTQPTPPITSMQKEQGDIAVTPESSVPHEAESTESSPLASAQPISATEQSANAETPSDFQNASAQETAPTSAILPTSSEDVSDSAVSDTHHPQSGTETSVENHDTPQMPQQNSAISAEPPQVASPSTEVQNTPSIQHAPTNAEITAANSDISTNPSNVTPSQPPLAQLSPNAPHTDAPPQHTPPMPDAAIQPQPSPASANTVQPVYAEGTNNSSQATFGETPSSRPVAQRTKSAFVEGFNKGVPKNRKK
jgi:hypothetical protein